MNNPPIEAATAATELDDNIHLETPTNSAPTPFSFEIEEKSQENQDLSEKLIKAKLKIVQLEKLITTSAAQLGQLSTELLKAKKELKQQLQESAIQKDYQAKEIETLKSELELSQSLLNGRCKRLERISNRNAALQADITRNKYKILSMHSKSSTEEVESTELSSQMQQSSTETPTTTISAATSEIAETSPSTMSEELESTNSNYSS